MIHPDRADSADSSVSWLSSYPIRGLDSQPVGLLVTGCSGVCLHSNILHLEINLKTNHPNKALGHFNLYTFLLK